MVKFKPIKKRESNKSGEPSIFEPLKKGVSFLKEKLSFLKWIDPFTYVDLFVMPQVKKITDSSTVEFLVNVFFALFFAWFIYTALGILFGSATPLVIVYSASMEDTFFRGDVMALGKVNENDYFGPEIIVDENVSRKPVSEFLSQNYDSEGRLVSFVYEGKEIPYLKNGSIVVYSAYNPRASFHGAPIIHRSILKIVANDGNFILTKGDNDQKKVFSDSANSWGYSNPTFDEDCGNVSNEFEISSKECITLYPIPVNQLQGKTFFMIPKVGCAKLWLVDDLFSLITQGKLPRDFRGIC